MTALEDVPAARPVAVPERSSERGSGVRRAGEVAVIGTVALVEAAWLGLLVYLLSLLL